MTQEILLQLLSGDYQNLKAAIEKEKSGSKTEDYLKQYDVKKHDVFDTTKRMDKGIEDDKGNVIKTEPVARLGLPIQKMIAQRAAAFLCANPVQLDALPKEGAEAKLMGGLQKTWDDNKLDYKSMDLAERMMSETEVAEIWYTEELEPSDTYWQDAGISAKFRLRLRVVSPSLGDSLYPVFDPTGNMVAFSRGYKLGGVERFDTYTDTMILLGQKTDSGWAVEPKENVIGKIPVIYYAQPEPEWADVQSLIDRLEAKISNHADTNDYFDSPMFYFEGEILSMPEKGKNGKAVQLGQGGKAGYLTWNEAPQSTKLEIDNLLRFIHAMTDTPDISFENLKGMGTTSGFALEMMFTGAHLKAARKAGVFGECIQRRINYLLAALSVIDLSLKGGLTLQVKPVFQFYLPRDNKELMDVLSTGVVSGIVSKKTAVRKLSIADDVEQEMQQIEAEGNSPSALDSTFN